MAGEPDTAVQRQAAPSLAHALDRAKQIEPCLKPKHAGHQSIGQPVKWARRHSSTLLVRVCHGVVAAKQIKRVESSGLKPRPRACFRGHKT